MECTTAMICEYFDHSNEWAHGERLQFEGFLYMLTHYTLNIVHIPMDSNKLEAIDRQDIVPVAITLFEKNMKEINKFGRMEGPSSGYNELNLKTHKSMKVETVHKMNLVYL